MKILATYRCPHSCVNPKLKARCPFSHVGDAEFTEKNQVPYFACLNYLTDNDNGCEKAVTVDDQVESCSSGYHISTSELVHLNHFSAKIATSIR